MDYILEYCEKLESLPSLSMLRKRISFLSHEMKMHVSNDLTPHEKLQGLSEFFFHQLNFKVFSEKQKSRSGLTEVICEKKGTAFSVGLLYRQLAQVLHVPLRFVQVPHLRLLKWSGQGHSLFVDLAQNGKVLLHADLLAYVQQLKNEGYDLGVSTFEFLDDRTVLMAYLSLLKENFGYASNTSQLLKIYECILQLQPQNISVIGERALLYYNLGCKTEARQELKRYFAFSNPRCSSPELTKMSGKF